MLKKVLKIILIGAVFVASFSLHYYPLTQKGYPPFIAAENLVQAKNLFLVNRWNVESEKNIVLASTLVDQQSQESDLPNRLTPWLWDQILDFLPLAYRGGGESQNTIPLLSLLILIPSLLFALATLLLYLLVKRHFGAKTSLFFVLILTLLPATKLGASIPAFYEFAFFFFAAGLTIFLWRQTVSLQALSLAGLLFSLSVLSRNAFLISFVALVFYIILETRSLKKSFVLVSSFAIGLILVSWLLDLGFVNAYFASRENSFALYGHLFPDPYTFHFEREEFLQKLNNQGFNVNQAQFAVQYGYAVPLTATLKTYLYSAIFYWRELFKIVISGGGLMIGLLVLGLMYLIQLSKSSPSARPNFAKLFFIWLITWYVLLIVLKTNNWDHFIEIGFILSLATALGVVWTMNLLTENLVKLQPAGIFGVFASIFKKVIAERTVFLIFFCLLTLQLVRANKWMYHEEYETGKNGVYLNYSQIINNLNVKPQEVIAVGLHPGSPYYLNFYTDKSFVYFAPSTIEKLLKEGKLQEAFSYFDVAYVLGYDESLLKSIIDETTAQIIR